MEKLKEDGFAKFKNWLQNHNIESFYDPNEELKIRFSDEDPIVGYVEDQCRANRSCLVCSLSSWNEDIAPFCDECHKLCMENLSKERENIEKGL